MCHLEAFVDKLTSLQPYMQIHRNHTEEKHVACMWLLEMITCTFTTHPPSDLACAAATDAVLLRDYGTAYWYMM